ncbi:hypothetical protein CDCA_CDCA05G1598 [Cyanidium caldarium]|uniref:Uncharacterized protein n=1 Tax=Cyanidium caldarium TaxID=2771 RepID=A0AAV9ITH3_CYACA|nr:hypothetical protein CDCA_CDCA05G1596 [Cyanidium caldarium]KAK4535573.1 hypothetical protein CDCA_CDCA05G1598 [Cyanidium caldarium]
MQRCGVAGAPAAPLPVTVYSVGLGCVDLLLRDVERPLAHAEDVVQFRGGVEECAGGGVFHTLRALHAALGTLAFSGPVVGPGVATMGSRRLPYHPCVHSAAVLVPRWAVLHVSPRVRPCALHIPYTAPERATTRRPLLDDAQGVEQIRDLLGHRLTRRKLGDQAHHEEEHRHAPVELLRV